MSRISFSNINSWQDFKSYAESLPNTKQMGDAFEHLTYLYFKLDPKYSFYDEVYKMSEVPSSDLEKLKIPRQDLGIDLIAKVGEEYHPIQCKYHTDKKRSITFSEVSTFLTQLGSNSYFKMGYIASSADNTSSNYNKLNTKEVQKLLNNTWFNLDKVFFDRVREFEKGKEYSPKPYFPREHQKTAVENAHKHFVEENNSRGKLIFPCGAGKSLTGYWMMEKLASKSTVVAVPSLSLIKQTLDVYLKEVVARNFSVKWLCICSDEGIGKNDDILYKTSEIGVPCTTDVNYIKDWLKINKDDNIIIFTTYQSGRIIADISKSLKFSFDLGIYDEAHKTVGKNESLFSYLLFEKNISIKNRIFMTATERFYRGVKDDVLSMDDPEDYGEVFSHMSFKEAIERELLTDYKVITIEVKKKEVAEFIKDNNLVKLNAKWGKESEARSLASMIALRKAMKALPIKNAVSFHSTIDKAVRSKEVQNHITKTYGYDPIETYTVSGKLPTSKREVVVNEFANSKKALITNSRCLTEGVDVPNIDCIVFADPRKSKVDIVQDLGRALRKKDGKDWGYVVLPIIYDHSTQEIDNDNFQEILNIVRGLAANDERIIEEFKDKSQNSGRVIGAREEIFSIDPTLLDEGELANNLSVKLWENLSRFKWLNYNQAEIFVHSLKLNSTGDWQYYTKSAKFPSTIPKAPWAAYSSNGWVSMGQWLGTGRVADQLKEYWSFEKARKFVHSLNLKSLKEWEEYCMSKYKPDEIPNHPRQTYEHKGWKDIGDWLGYVSFLKKDFLTYDEAKKFVRKNRIKTYNEYNKFYKSRMGKIPLPGSPIAYYRNKGWISSGDFFSTGVVAHYLRKYRSFENAREYARELKLESVSEWRAYFKKNIKPDDISLSPHNTYKNRGWISWGDWLGNKRIADGTQNWVSYKKAKEFIKKNNIRSKTEWNDFKKHHKLPVNIPRNPYGVYNRKNVWIDWKDFFGKKENIERDYLSLTEIKEFVKKLGIKNSLEWKAYSKSGIRPKNIPGRIDLVFKDQWKGWPDFFGKK